MMPRGVWFGEEYVDTTITIPWGKKGYILSYSVKFTENWVLYTKRTLSKLDRMSKLLKTLWRDAGVAPQHGALRYNIDNYGELRLSNVDNRQSRNRLSCAPVRRNIFASPYGYTACLVYVLPGIFLIMYHTWYRPEFFGPRYGFFVIPSAWCTSQCIINGTGHKVRKVLKVKGVRMILWGGGHTEKSQFGHRTKRECKKYERQRREIFFGI